MRIRADCSFQFSRQQVKVFHSVLAEEGLVCAHLSLGSSFDLGVTYVHLKSITSWLCPRVEGRFVSLSYGATCNISKDYGFCFELWRCKTVGTQRVQS